MCTKIIPLSASRVSPFSRKSIIPLDVVRCPSVTLPPKDFDIWIINPQGEIVTKNLAV